MSLGKKQIFHFPGALIAVLALLITLFTTSCDAFKKDNPSDHQPSVVEIKSSEGKYRLFVNNKEFYVNGAGSSKDKIKELSEHGANALRTWGINQQKHGLAYLDEAHKHGLKVMIGLYMGKERHGFDYNDATAVEAQLQDVKNLVYAYKDHPALLGWIIGNELNLHSTNLKVWNAVDEVSRMIHTVDGKHPTTTALAGINKTIVDYLKKIDSDLDFLSVQFYGNITNLADFMNKSGYEGPYMVTEWGPTGHWEMPKTEWNAAIEQSSSEKSKAFIERYQNAIIANDDKCMGSFVFLWGQKQERTPTWYGLFTENDEEVETIDALHWLWNNEWPEYRSPTITDATINNLGRFDNIKLSAGEESLVKLKASDEDSKNLKLRIEILEESTDLQDGGDFENRPERVYAAIMELGDGTFKISNPKEEGAYRLFIYVLDETNHAATINIPFFVN